MNDKVSPERLAELIADYDDIITQCGDALPEAGMCMGDTLTALRQLQALGTQPEELRRANEEMRRWESNSGRWERTSRELLAQKLALKEQLRAQGEDAERYRWLRTRINWREVGCREGELSWGQREWTHVDLRPNRPDSEHIDEYIDAAREAAHKGEKP